eukprot:1161177-Pelagomonas_calceolata.AAC.7
MFLPAAPEEEVKTSQELQRGGCAPPAPSRSYFISTSQLLLTSSKHWSISKPAGQPSHPAKPRLLSADEGSVQL